MTELFPIEGLRGFYGFVVIDPSDTRRVVHTDWTPRSRIDAFMASHNWLRRHQNEVFWYGDRA
jgi:hypothetical protein